MSNTVGSTWTTVSNVSHPRRPPTCGQKRVRCVLHPAGPRAVKPIRTARGWGWVSMLYWRAPRRSPPAAGRLRRAGRRHGDASARVRGSGERRARFVKLPLHQARVPVYKGLVRQIRRGHGLRRDGGGRLPVAPTPPGDPSCRLVSRSRCPWSILSCVIPLHSDTLCRMPEGMSLAQ